MSDAILQTVMPGSPHRAGAQRRAALVGEIYSGLWFAVAVALAAVLDSLSAILLLLVKSVCTSLKCAQMSIELENRIGRNDKAAEAAKEP